MNYLESKFKLRLPGIDRLCDFIRAKDRGFLIYKLDLQRAYRQLPVDPKDYRYLDWNLIEQLLNDDAAGAMAGATPPQDSPGDVSQTPINPGLTCPSQLHRYLWQLQMLQLEKEKLQLELQVLRFQKESASQSLKLDHTPTDSTKKNRYIVCQLIPGNWSSFDSLDQADFLAGYLTMIKAYDVAKKKSNMIDILGLLAIKAMNYCWSNVISFYAFIAKQLS